jgi:hypothetical protein
MWLEDLDEDDSHSAFGSNVSAYGEGSALGIKLLHSGVTHPPLLFQWSDLAMNHEDTML